MKLKIHGGRSEASTKVGSKTKMKKKMMIYLPPPGLSSSEEDPSFMIGSMEADLRMPMFRLPPRPPRPPPTEDDAGMVLELEERSEGVKQV